MGRSRNGKLNSSGSRNNRQTSTKGRRELRSAPIPQRTSALPTLFQLDQWAATAKSIEVATNRLRRLAINTTTSPQPRYRLNAVHSSSAQVDSNQSIPVETELIGNNGTANDSTAYQITDSNDSPIPASTTSNERMTSLPTVLSEISVRLGATLSELQGLAIVLSDIVTTSADTTTHQPKRKFSRSDQLPRKRKPLRSRTTTSNDSNSCCTVCGRRNHTKSSCHFLEPDGTSWHPNANLSDEPWAMSDFGRQFAERFDVQLLPTYTDVDGDQTIPPARLNLVQPQSRPK